MKVFTLVDFEQQVLSIHANRASAELRMSELVLADKEHWFNTFGDYDGDFDNYQIDEFELVS